jgi:hypothetical protein
MSQLAQPVTFTPDGHLAPSFDAAAATATAEMNTPLGQCRAAARGLTKPKDQENALEDCYVKRLE